jgi:hypothetical protein
MKEILKKQKELWKLLRLRTILDFYLLKSQIAQFEGNQAAALKIGMLLCLRK